MRDLSDAAAVGTMEHDDEEEGSPEPVIVGRGGIVPMEDDDGDDAAVPESGVDPWSYLARLGVRMRSPWDPFFADGDAVCGMRQCTYLTQEDDEEFLHPSHPEFPCPAPECPATFTLLLDFESHYSTLHKHECSECSRTLPSAHLLELHLAETHDSFFAVMTKKSASFECFLQKCREKFWNPEDRRNHCIKRHQFPEDFKFGDVSEVKPAASSTPSASAASTPRRRKASSAQQSQARAKSSPARDKLPVVRPAASVSNIPVLVASPASRTAMSPSQKVMERAAGGGGRRGSSRMDLDQSGRDSMIPRPTFSTPNSSPTKSASAQAPRATSLSPKLKPSHLRNKKNNNNNKSRVAPSTSATSRRPHSVMVTAGDARKLEAELEKKARETAGASSQETRRRFSLAAITGRGGGDEMEVDDAAAGDAVANLERARASSVAAVEATTAAARISNCDTDDDGVVLRRTSAPSDARAAASSTRSNPETPLRRAPLSLARMGERLSSTTTTTGCGDSSSSPSSSSLGSTSVGVAEDPSPTRRASRIPVFKRSFSCKVPQQICFGSDSSRAFDPASRRHWHSRPDGLAPSSSSVAMDFESDFRTTLPDV